MPEQMAVTADGTGERADVDDVTIDVGDLGYGPRGPGADDDPGTLSYACRIEGFVDEAPGQAGVVLGVEVKQAAGKWLGGWRRARPAADGLILNWVNSGELGSG